MYARTYVAPLVGITVALLVGSAGEYGYMLETKRIDQDQRSRVASVVGQYRASLEGELNATLYLTNGLIAYVETHSLPDPKVSQAMLKTLYQQGPHIRNIGLAPGNRLTYIYPLQGNEKAIGLYYPDLPDQWPAVQRAIEERKPRLAGPIHLKQGGTGFIYRVPVFIGPHEQYWGLLSMVLDQDSLFEQAGIAPQVDHLQIALRGQDGAGASGETFMGDALLFASDAVTAMINTPGGTWQIAAMPAGGWSHGRRIGWLRVGGWIVGVLLGMASYLAWASVARRLRAEQSVKASRDELNEAQRIAMIGSWILDLRNNQLKWTDEIFRILEIDPDRFEASYEGFLKNIHPDDRGRVSLAYTESLASRTPYSIDHRLLLPDGRIKYVRERCETLYAEDGTPLLSRGTVQDITKMHEAEEALRTSEERWKFALEGAGDGVWDWNIQTGELFLSRQEMTVLGYAGEDATHTHIDVWVVRQHPDDLPLRKAAIEKYFAGEAPLYICEFRTQARDGSWRWLLARGMLVSRTPDGKPLRMIGTHTDITERKHAEEEIMRLSQRNELLLNSAGEGIYGVDLEFLCTFINPAALGMLNFSRKELVFHNPHEMFHHHHEDGSIYPIEVCPVSLTLQDGIRRETEEVFFRKDGSSFPVHMTATPILDGGKIVGAEVVFQDISRRKAMEHELVRLATTDSLTGAANRRRFLEQFDLELIRARRSDKPMTLLMLDLDHFKSINDHFGHAVGDSVLKHFSSLAQQCLRRIDLLGRLGGEEFGILLPETDKAGAWQLADRLRRLVADTPATTDKGEVTLTVSIGLAELDASDVTADSLIARADSLLYQAKAGGRNQVKG